MNIREFFKDYKTTRLQDHKTTSRDVTPVASQKILKSR